MVGASVTRISFFSNLVTGVSAFLMRRINRLKLGALGIRSKLNNHHSEGDLAHHSKGGLVVEFGVAGLNKTGSPVDMFCCAITGKAKY